MNSMNSFSISFSSGFGLLPHTLPILALQQDGPTHQPVETVSGLRVFPNMDVIRPADPEETAAAYAASIDRKEGPTALILTRQNVRTLKEIPVCGGATNLIYHPFLMFFGAQGTFLQHLFIRKWCTPKTTGPDSP